MAAGDVLIGIRIFNLNLIAVQNDAWKPNLAILGLIRGGLSLLGHAAILGINHSIDIKLMMLMK
jgi:hypothetical protein